MNATIPERFNLATEFLDAPAARHPERAAILGEPREATYGQLAALANRVGNALLDLGVARGQRVLIVLPDSAELMAAFFGAAKIGAISVPVNPSARAADYAHYANDSGPSVAIVHSLAIHEFLPASGARPQMPIVLVGDESVETGGIQCLKWSAWTGAANDSLPAASTLFNDSAFFLYTSGSGGPPKAAVHQHKDMLVTSRAYARDVLGLHADDVTFSVSKLFFAYGLGNGMYFPFFVGARTVVNPEPTKIDRVMEIVARHRPTVFFAVPTFYAAALRDAEAGKIKLDFSSVRRFVSAGEALPAELFAQWRQRIGIEILDGIGSTEMLHVFLSNRPNQARPGSCGVPVPGYQAKIVDDLGEAVQDGALGNLWVSGESAFAEYWGLPELTADTKRGDWVATGDKFIRDADGRYQYCGRADDMLKVAGMWVSPMEVENALLAYPCVAEAAVIGATDSQGLAYPLAYVVLRREVEGTAQLAEEIRKHVRARLAAYMTPREIRFCGELPKTATGKIQRFKLRET